MSTRTVPAQTLVICDVCQVENPPRVKGAVLLLKRNALDYLGNAAADGSVSFDLCDECERIVSAAINEATTRVRAAQGKA